MNKSSEIDANSPKCQFEMCLHRHGDRNENSDEKKSTNECYNYTNVHFSNVKRYIELFSCWCQQHSFGDNLLFAVGKYMLTFFTSIDVRRFTLNFSWFTFFFIFVCKYFSFSLRRCWFFFLLCSFPFKLDNQKFASFMHNA